MNLLAELLDYGSSGAKSKAATVLGSSARVKQLVNFYRNDNNKKSLQLIMTRGLLDFASEAGYTPGELAAFNKGLSVVLDFMIEAELEQVDK